jgi:hypothetical protein
MDHSYKLRSLGPATRGPDALDTTIRPFSRMSWFIGYDVMILVGLHYSSLLFRCMCMLMRFEVVKVILFLKPNNPFILRLSNQNFQNE